MRRHAELPHHRRCLERHQPLLQLQQRHLPLQRKGRLSGGRVSGAAGRLRPLHRQPAPHRARHVVPVGLRRRHHVHRPQPHPHIHRRRHLHHHPDGLHGRRMQQCRRAKPSAPRHRAVGGVHAPRDHSLQRRRGAHRRHAAAGGHIHMARRQHRDAQHSQPLGVAGWHLYTSHTGTRLFADRHLQGHGAARHRGRQPDRQQLPRQRRRAPHTHRGGWHQPCRAHLPLLAHPAHAHHRHHHSLRQPRPGR